MRTDSRRQSLSSAETVTRALLRVCEVGWSGLLVAGVQCIISAGDEHFAPLEERSREEARDRADDDLLEKSGVHFRYL